MDAIIINDKQLCHAQLSEHGMNAENADTYQSDSDREALFKSIHS